MESYANGCRSISSPIKHLPTDVLVQIFGLCSLRGGNGKMPTPAEEVERVSQNHLLRLSQVCAYWHRIAMGTPSLWSTLVFDTHVWPRCSEPPTTLIRCITSALQRGGEFPLSLDIVVDSAQPIQQTLLELLSRHSHRWKSLCIMLPMSAFRFLNDAKGNILLLESLTLGFATHDDTSYTDDVFEIASRSEDVGGAGFPVAHPRLPWAQLRLFNYQNGHSGSLSLDMLTHLSQTVQLVITPTAIPFGLHPVTSNAETLIVGFITDPDPPHTRTILGAILECLTLPCLTQLRFIRPDVPPPLWNQPKFVDFAARSSLCDTLTTFEVWAKIAEDDLVECLSLLRSLQVLLLWDCPDYIVITDSLLHHISWAGENSLLPHLRHLCLISHLRIHCKIASLHVLPLAASMVVGLRRRSFGSNGNSPGVCCPDVRIRRTDIFS
ncbi:hypothetical protein B0H16DRAFT_1416205 [Mycena metata]|uniref:F-box domain-containing protein n=1 Tax=Mycena metata TaxID=1033252 RepID=A0AAD7J7E2_9AGAR|nr:hypothetical protein B0H16DRAFT_1416205 [Mycena metata]